MYVFLYFSITTEDEFDGYSGNDGQYVEDFSDFDTNLESLNEDMNDMNLSINDPEFNLFNYNIDVQQSQSPSQVLEDNIESSVEEISSKESDDILDESNIKTEYVDEQLKAEDKNNTKLQQDHLFPPDFLKSIESLETSRTKKRDAPQFTLSKILNLPHPTKEENLNTDGDSNSEYRARSLSKESESS